MLFSIKVTAIFRLALLLSLSEQFVDFLLFNDKEFYMLLFMPSAVSVTRPYFKIFVPEDQNSSGEFSPICCGTTLATLLPARRIAL